MSTALAWFKSSHSMEEGGACLEVALAPDHIHVRDSKHTPTTGPELHVASATWQTFTAYAAAQPR
ncbi:DUF397 domain-containing protein [Streptomyces sp. J2-1]|uniref:DUF397 domain-containing protein n=1 Tax=Streptomyces corallincola TaxID=2851888 RepID=UPI001C38CE03|nr:DUF397 domain-containing protein [Streptomyces corallincola]MBV2354971.1 DUF397 domain-containing protein [Streptomyces corallincola]